MSFDLRIIVTGLCLFVRDQSSAGAPLRVLLLSHGSGKDEHFPRLVYDKAYADAKATQLSYNLACIPLEKKLLRFGAASGGTLNTNLPDAIVSLDRHLQTARLARKYLTGDGAGQISARIVLAGGCVSDCGAPDTYDVTSDTKAEGKVSLASLVEWTIRGLPNRALENWGLTRLSESEDAAPSFPLPALHPIGETIQLQIYNVPEGELPLPDPSLPPKHGDNPPHFSPYYDCVQGPRKKLTLDLSEVPIKSDCKQAAGAPAADVVHRWRGSHQKCYLAQVTAA